jgi:hypothetical protein
LTFFHIFHFFLLNSDKIWKIRKINKLNREKIAKIWKKRKLNSEKIWKV